MTDGAARLALVTGGCRRVGAAISAALAKEGWDLALHGHSNAQPEPALTAVLEATGCRWHGMVADLSDSAVPETLIEGVVAHFGRTPDLLVNNASLFDYDDWQSVTRQSLDTHFAVNAHAPVLLARALVAQSPEGSQPAIIHIVDQRVRNPNGDQLAYTLSKQALAESIRTLACAFGPRARINGIAPGLTLPTADYSAKQMQRLALRMPLHRLSSPHDIAEAALYLASARSVTGQMLFVDGGAHMLSFDRDFVFLDHEDDA